MSQQEIDLTNRVEQFRKFVDKRTDIDKTLFTPGLMSMCLRLAEYDVEKAFSLAIKYCKQRFERKIKIESKEKLLKMLESSLIRVSSNKATLRGETIILFDLCSWNSKEFDEELIPCTISIVIDYLLRDDLFQMRGCYILFDILGLKLKHLSQIRKRLIKKILNALEYTAPIKIIKLFLITQTSSFSQMVFLKFFKKCISKELREKMTILKKTELTNFIDPNLLSLKYEGTLQEMKFLNLSILIAEALQNMPGYDLDSGSNLYCPFEQKMNIVKDETDTDNETLNENLSKLSCDQSYGENRDKLESSANLEQSTSGSNN